MSKITMFVYCEGAEITNGKTALINPMQVLTPAFVPSTYSFNIAIGLLDFDVTKPHTIRVVFSFKENGKVVFDTGVASLSADNSKKVIDIEMQNTLLNLELKNVILESNGEYEACVIIDEEEKGRYPIRVKGAH